MDILLKISIASRKYNFRWLRRFVWIRALNQAGVDLWCNLSFLGELKQLGAADFSPPGAQRACQQIMIVSHEFFPRQDFGSPWASQVDANPWAIKRRPRDSGCDSSHSLR
jgi:hypothetical protein